MVGIGDLYSTFESHVKSFVCGSFDDRESGKGSNSIPWLEKMEKGFDIVLGLVNIGSRQ